MNADELRKADEIVRALRRAERYCLNEYGTMAKQAADLIESLQSQLEASQRSAQDARNELCQKCGRYREAHKGACDGCRWTA